MAATQARENAAQGLGNHGLITGVLMDQMGKVWFAPPFKVDDMVCQMRESMQINTLEKGLLERFLEGTVPDTAKRSAFWRGLTVTSRNLTGVGFMTELEPSSEMQLFEEETSVRWSGAGARLGPSATDTAYLVYVDAGRVRALEGFTYGGEPWPSRIDAIDWYVLKEGMDLESRPGQSKRH